MTLPRRCPSLRTLTFVVTAALATLLAATVAGTVRAEERVRLSWNSCAPWTPHEVFTGPGIYKVVVSATGCSGSYQAHDTAILLRTRYGCCPEPPVMVDAWRFDELGCQGSGRIAISTASFDEGCPALQGTAPLVITDYAYGDPWDPAVIRLANTFGEISADSTARYTLWVISLDHTHSVVGPTDPGTACGGVEQPMYFLTAYTMFLHASGEVTQASNSEASIWWDGSVPTLPTTWGRVKSLFR